jgi:transcription termination factor Rho
LIQGVIFMREKLETLPMAQLRELAKAQGIKSSGIRKAELIDLLVEAAEKKPENKPQEIHSLAAKPAAGLQDSDMSSEKPAAEAVKPAAFKES